MSLPADYLYRIYRRRGVPPSTLRLAPFQWAFYTELDGRRTVLEIAHHVQYPEAACEGALKGLLTGEVIEEVVLTFAEHMGAAPPPEPPPVPQRTLDDVIRFITQRSGKGMEAKLAVYRVFLQVPPALLKAEGLTTLAFSETATEIRSPELRAAISEATRRMLGEAFEWN